MSSCIPIIRSKCTWEGGRDCGSVRREEEKVEGRKGRRERRMMGGKEDERVEGKREGRKKGGKGDGRVESVSQSVSYIVNQLTTQSINQRMSE